MAMFVIPTWRVTYLFDGREQQTVRVSETDLEAFIRVLVFNKAQDFTAEVERLPWSLATDLGNEPDREEAT